MPEPFKNLFSEKVIASMGDHFARVWTEFPREEFVAAASEGLDGLELKQRSQQITQAMAIALPADFALAADILHRSLAQETYVRKKEEHICPEGICGWAIMPMTYYVGQYGLGHFDLAMELLREMTKRFTSEFGIRPLIIAEPERCLALFAKWVNDPDEHVRRLVSEGARPRLPWGTRLTRFIADPTPVLPLLAALRDDPSEYVRRSVANHLNDISKDHPDLVAGIAGEWLQGDPPPERRRLVRHACRSLVKKGHGATLRAFGYRSPKVEIESLTVETPVVEFGRQLEFELSLVSRARGRQALLIDYAIHHRKANGQLSPKVFKWKILELAGGDALLARRRHPIREISTRKYYPGLHRLEILVNGQSLAMADFELHKAPSPGAG